jgi:hypothetical protein
LDLPPVETLNGQLHRMDALPKPPSKSPFRGCDELCSAYTRLKSAAMAFFDRLLGFRD